MRQQEINKSWQRADKVARLRQEAHEIVKDRPYTAGRLYLIAQDIEDRQPLSPSDREFLENN